MKDTRSAGFALIAGVVVMILTIIQEVQIGWIAPERAPEETRAFLAENWDAMERIWSLQALGHVGFVAGALVLTGASNGLRSLVWALLAVSSTLTLVAMLLTVGGYGPALAAGDSAPALFESLRGAIGAVYRVGKAGGALLFVALVLEAFAGDGAVSRRAGLITLIATVAAIAIAATCGVPMKAASAAAFLVPLALGVGYARGVRGA